MTPTEVSAARERLGLTPERLAAEFAVTEKEVRGWEAGVVRIPRRYAERLAWQAAVAERDAALAASGLPECGWVTEWQSRPTPERVNDRTAHFRAVVAHAESCPVCLAREAYVTEHLPSMPDPTLPLSMKFFAWVSRILDRVPSRFRPAVVGAAVVAGLTGLNAAFAILPLLRTPERLPAVLLGLLVALPAAAVAGAIGGLAFSAVRPVLEPLGRIGDYLTGIACVLAYMGPFGVVALLVAGSAAFASPVPWVIFGGCVVFFGLFLGHVWFYQERKDGMADGGSPT